MKALHISSLGFKISFLFIFAVMLLIGSGCSIALKHGALEKPTQTCTGDIEIRTRAEGLGEKAGWGRFTVFYLPLVPVHIEGDGSQKVMEHIRDALQQVGYRVTEVDSQTLCKGPYVTCKVEKFMFNNYTWTFPLVPTWGEIQLKVSLLSPDEKLLWSRDFSGKGTSMNFFNGYSSAANKSMKKILSSMVKEFSSQEFSAGLTQSK